MALLPLRARVEGGMPTYSPLLYDYLKKYQEDPTSRVFAPLAEAYRKAGLVEEAIEIARQGLRVHPQFVGGKVALARALFDRKEYVEVIETLKPVVQDVPDNLVAQRLIAESCLLTGRVAEALDAYKMLLYFVPSDAEIQRVVQELETQAYEKGALVLQLASTPSEEGESRSVRDPLVDTGQAKRAAWVRRVELLQEMLSRVDRYRAASIR